MVRTHYPSDLMLETMAVDQAVYAQARAARLSAMH